VHHDVPLLTTASQARRTPRVAPPRWIAKAGLLREYHLDGDVLGPRGSGCLAVAERRRKPALREFFSSAASTPFTNHQSLITFRLRLLIPKRPHRIYLGPIELLFQLMKSIITDLAAGA
jgi:hypothetical protein